MTKEERLGYFTGNAGKDVSKKEVIKALKKLEVWDKVEQYVRASIGKPELQPYGEKDVIVEEFLTNEEFFSSFYLFAAFDWQKTEEGSDFWGKKNNEFYDILGVKNPAQKFIEELFGKF